MNISIAAYYNDYENLLSTRFDDIDGTAVAVFGNAGAIEAAGDEAELNWNITPDWSVSFFTNLSDSTYSDFVTPNPLASGGETINGINNLRQLDVEQVQQTPDNATDGEILVRTLRFGGDIIVSDYAAPRTFGVRFGYKF